MLNDLFNNFVFKITDLITPKKEGIILAEPSDSKAIAEAIDYLMDSEVRQKMGHSARLLAEEFTPERNAAEMFKVYEKLIEVN